MLALRSLFFNVAFYAMMIVWMICLIPVLAASRGTMLRCIKAWGRANMRLLRWIAGTRVELRGLEHVPRGGLLVAAKHQSFLETFVLLTVLDDPAYVLKRELTYIPLFGWLQRKAEQIPIDRGGRSAALTALNERARAETQRGRQIIIFPEGTRRPPGAPPSYKYGIVHLYTSCGVPCLPIALNTGLFWPRRSFLRRSGTAVIEFLPPLPQGLAKEQVLASLEARIEAASDRLLAAGNAELGGSHLAGPKAKAASEWRR